MFLKFPENFYWGAATSSYQVEGNNHNDWSEWEKKNAERLAKESKSKYGHWLPVWREIKEQAKNQKNYISGVACDHYNRFREDFDIAKSLNHNAHRFSIEWSRIEPEQGKFNEKEIDHYRQVIAALRERGIEPFVTLWHWTNPIWIRNIGGWENKKTVYYFNRYVEKIASSLNDLIKFYIVLNEPRGWCGSSYSYGKFPPQKKNLLSLAKVITNLINAHITSYKLIHKTGAGNFVGTCENLRFFEAHDNKPMNRVLKYFSDNWNYYFLNKIQNHQDFIGLNYYFHNRVKFNILHPIKSFENNENKIVSDMGWEIYPEGIYCVLKDLKKYGKPIYITENGLADAKDKKRENFIKEHLRWIHKAIAEDVDVRGYFYWSLFDNFEWDKGFWPRFGLVEIDYQTLERKIRKSALAYSEICKNNGFEL